MKSNILSHLESLNLKLQKYLISLFRFCLITEKIEFFSMPVAKPYKTIKIPFCLRVFCVTVQFESKINSIFVISAKNCIRSDMFFKNVIFAKNPPVLPLSLILRKITLRYPPGSIFQKKYIFEKHI